MAEWEMTFIDNAPPDIKKPEQTSDNSLPTPSKDISKDMDINIYKDIIGGYRGLVMGAIGALVRVWREYNTVASYSVNDLFAHNEDGSIYKLWILVPWWGEVGFQLREVTVILYPKILTKKVKHNLRKAAAKLNYPDRRRIHSTTTIILCRQKRETRPSPGSGVFIIEHNKEEGYRFFKWLAVSLENLVEGIVAGLGPNIFRSTQRVVEFDQLFIAELRDLENKEIEKLNESGKETKKSTILGVGDGSA
jgi:hypothetical protein